MTAIADAAFAPPASARRVVLRRPDDVEGFKRACRWLLAMDAQPAQVQWCVADRNAGLFDADAAFDVATANGAAVQVPRAYAELAPWAALHGDEQRHALLYRLLWRLQRDPSLRHDRLDADWRQAAALAREVRRDLHKMKAYVRFRPMARPDAPTLQIAWFEPQHHVVAAAAPHFRARYAQMHWSILTPLGSVSWDGTALHHGPAAQRHDVPADEAGDALWLTYYEHIFNPARLKLRAMEREMPRRYWRNLPEAALIAPLAADAARRSAQMIDCGPTQPPAWAERARALPGTGKTRLGTAPAVDTPSEADLSDPPPMAPRTTTTSMGQPVARPVALVRAQSPSSRRAAWAETRDAALGCTNCPLYADATQTVFGQGPIDAPLMFVGEQPGDHEDLRGLPFVGPAGQLFDRALAQLDYDRSRAYVTNAVKHFKFELRGKRRMHKTPAQREATACLPWLEREIALVRPHAVVALGATAAKSLLGRPVAVLRERGQWIARPDGLRVLVTLHPSALLRMPSEERDAAYQAWLQDLRIAIQAALEAAH